MSESTNIKLLSNSQINQYLNNTLRAIERMNARLSPDEKKAAHISLEIVLANADAIQWHSINERDDFDAIAGTMLETYDKACDTAKLVSHTHLRPLKFLQQMTTRFIGLYLADESFISNDGTNTMLGVLDNLSTFSLSVIAYSGAGEFTEPEVWVKKVDDILVPWAMVLLCFKLFYSPLTGNGNEPTKQSRN